MRTNKTVRSLDLRFSYFGEQPLREGEGCGCKRILEVTVLAGLSSKLAVPHLLPGDLVALLGWWPVPSGSRHGLRKIMPSMTTKIREQQALKAISLTLGSGGNGKSVPVCTISAMLCFWNEHKITCCSGCGSGRPVASARVQTRQCCGGRRRAAEAVGLTGSGGFSCERLRHSGF